jgi:predicted ATPase
MTGASGQKRVPSKYLLTHEFSLPPTREQERIVAKLDAALSRIERAEIAAHRAQKRLKRYRAAVLHAASTGELTSAWREVQSKSKTDQVETSEALLQRFLATRRARWEKSELEHLHVVGKKPKDDKWKARYPAPTPVSIAGLPSLPDGWTWPDKPMNGYRLSYEMDEHIVEVSWRPMQMKRPELKRGPIPRNAKTDIAMESIKREQLPLPRFVFGYYSGPTNRLAEHFLPMEQDHYDRLRLAKTDDAKTLAKLLEQRRFFCAETHHAKYVLLGFSYKEDPKISEFLENRLRIVGFESALFIIRRPLWAKSGSRAEDFWGATGIMRRVMERLRRYAIAPMELQQKVNYGYRSTTEDHYYFFLPDLESLHSFAAEYQDARTFFLALESTDFSELIHDVKIQVRVKATNTQQVSITFHQLSEGEQQLLMVLGLMRFTKSHQSLVLLDEPDTHLNPHWSVDYIKDLARVMSDNAIESTEQQTSQILMATHDPLVIASLLKEQIHLLKRDTQTGACKWEPATVNPRGLGFTGILTSEMFGFRSDLDAETLGDLDNRVRLIAKEDSLTPQQKKELEEIDKRLAAAGFSKAFSDPYYAAFVRAWGRRHSQLMAGQQFLTPEKRQEIDRIASEVLKEAVAEVEKEVEN